ncbi:MULTISPECIES: GNAT family N-acetyltransferase [Pseudomonas]|uniref:GNAT family N-acetyltransferase n=1 Tax=Pseudomonas TaxID=286 RepID=UPI000D00F883|nr:MULTISPECIES: GNAT family N-acetyltransferase [Pseudomonas]PRA47413.1 GNAT family N-acetyltransferase [Pseudomonas sp. MYb115]QXN47863.1 GNAT family N-acetyltransferase [Pseudomonas fluorescens]WSO22170.1 GNAT family N-acetyltransferase [Pseudomonas fluorescens]
MSLLIRLAGAADASAISQVVLAALRESNAADYSPEIIEQVAANFSPAAILGLLEQRQVFVATNDQQVIATASLDRDVVRSVFVDPRHQGSGVGRQLMAAIHQAATLAGIDTLRVPSSLTAEGFYRRLGYEVRGEQLHGAERTIIMQKHLPARTA